MLPWPPLLSRVEDATTSVEVTARYGPGVVFLGPVIKVAVATVTDAGKFEWWAGRVQQMKRKSAGKSGRYVPTTVPMLFMEAKSSKLQVICSWYSKHVFNDGPIDTKSRTVWSLY